MASIKEKGLTGLVGRVVTYTLNGRAVVRSRPKPYEQTKASRSSARQFGAVKKISSFLRKGLLPFMDATRKMELMFTNGCSRT